MLNDAVAQVKSAESVTLKWIPIEFLPSEHIKTELDQTKVSWFLFMTIIIINLKVN